MADRALDYYMKGLPIEVRQAIFDKFRNDISPTMMKYFLERDSGYESFKSMGFSPENIAAIGEMYSHKFEEINGIMTDNEREPLFSTPSDSFVSAQEYVEIFRERTKEELVEMFGTDLDGYDPQVLKKKLDKEQEI